MPEDDFPDMPLFQAGQARPIPAAHARPPLAASAAASAAVGPASCGPAAKPLPPLGPAARPTAEVVALAPRALALAKKIAARFGRRFPMHAAEAESAAVEAAWIQATRYDPDNPDGATYETYARPRIVGAIQDQMRLEMPAGYRRLKPGESRESQRAPKVQPFSDSVQSGGSGAEPGPVGGRPAEGRASGGRSHACLSRDPPSLDELISDVCLGLPGSASEILRLRHISNLAFEDIAAAMSCTPRQARKDYERALWAVRDRMAERMAVEGEDRSDWLGWIRTNMTDADE